MKTMKILFLLLMILSAALFSSCADSGSTVPGKPADTATPAMASADTSPESAPPASPSAPSQESAPVLPPAEFEFEEKTYTDGDILVKYPQITDMDDSAAREALNKMISDTALRDVTELPSGTEYELSYEITFNTPAVISMYFEGYAYVPETAHPYQFLRALTIDTARTEPIRLQTLLNAVDGVVDVIINGRYSASGYDMTEEYEAAIKENLSSMGDDFWLDEIRKADAPNSATASFLTEDALVISVSVPHVMGDHVEIYLPFEDLAGFRTDNPIWQEILK